MLVYIAMRRSDFGDELSPAAQPCEIMHSNAIIVIALCERLDWDGMRRDGSRGDVDEHGDGVPAFIEHRRDASECKKSVGFCALRTSAFKTNERLTGWQAIEYIAFPHSALVSLVTGDPKRLIHYTLYWS